MFNKNTNKVQTKTPKSIMFKEFFYEHSKFAPNEIEDLLATRESVYAPVIEKITNNLSVTLSEYKTLTEFRHIMYYRSNEFFAFHTHRKRRGSEDWQARRDWKSINGIYLSDDYEGDIKKSQLIAIKNVIERNDAAYSLSMMTPVCFLFRTIGKKFMIGDSGSLGRGGEFDGMTIIILSPEMVIMFPRIQKAMEIISKLSLDRKKPTIIHEDITDDKDVDLINEMTKEDSFEYYIIP